MSHLFIGEIVNTTGQRNEFIVWQSNPILRGKYFRGTGRSNYIPIDSNPILFQHVTSPPHIENIENYTFAAFLSYGVSFDRKQYHSRPVSTTFMKIARELNLMAKGTVVYVVISSAEKCYLLGAWFENKEDVSVFEPVWEGLLCQE
ncbi:hypothetical protein CL653_03420 [bacterium]|nr:hypothetical protein [bacterium]|tara:strand:- start:1021 stop:1458 length:438 start_codon:yes stop_codon:yes gene_type:complete